MGRVVVAGSINMDVVAQANRLPLRGETIVGIAVSLIPGGKGANQAVAARRAGADVAMVGALGSDEFATVLRSFLDSEKLEMSGVEKTDGSTGTAVIVVDQNGDNTIVIVPGANSAVTPQSIEAVKLERGDVLLLQDEIPENANAAAIDIAKARGALTVLNLAPFRRTSEQLLSQISYLVVNETEFAEMTGEGPSPMPSHRVAGLLAEGAGYAHNVVVTLGAEGLHARIGSSVISVDGHPVQAVDTTGAGDCFCGTFGTALAEGQEPEAALRFANASAALSVQKLGAGPSMPTRAEIIDALANAR